MSFHAGLRPVVTPDLKILSWLSVPKGGDGHRNWARLIVRFSPQPQLGIDFSDFGSAGRLKKSSQNQNP
jgi:hypothetical protein